MKYVIFADPHLSGKDREYVDLDGKKYPRKEFYVINNMYNALEQFKVENPEEEKNLIIAGDIFHHKNYDFNNKLTHTLYPIKSLKDTNDLEKTKISKNSNQIILMDEGFEGYNDTSGWVPPGWTNTGWLWDFYGFSHNGSHWGYSWASGDKLTTPYIYFDTNTELSFWYAAEKVTVL